MDNLQLNISAVKTDMNKEDIQDLFRFWKKQKGVWGGQSVIQNGWLVF